MDQYYFKTPFASSGDKTAIPEATQPDGKVSFVQGFTFDYERDLTTDPLAKAIPRNQDNWLHYAITDALRQYQQVGIPEWITPTDNGGSPFAYARAVLVIKGGIVYQSLVAANTGTPGLDADKWVPIPLLDQIAAATAAKWATPRSLSLTGDVTAAFVSVDGSANVSAVATLGAGVVKGSNLENSGVTPGTYGSASSIPIIGVDSKGRVTSATSTAIDVIPSGAVSFFARSSAPTGWLKCNGAAVSRTTYASLFAAIGTLWGNGDGTTTFNLPDLRGEFLRVLDDGRGIDPGRAFGSAQADAFKSHFHSTTINKNSSGGSAPAVGAGDNDNKIDYYVTDATGDTETRPRNIALLACIKV